MGFPMMPQGFEGFFRCYPIAMMPDNVRKDDANYGGKIFLPPSSLQKLTMLNIRYPMLFELINEDANLKTHSGVLEFVAEEGRAYLPQWMMDTLQLQPGSIAKILNQNDIPLGKFVKIEPQSVDFLDISDPKAVLENVLRKFSTLTVNDIIEVNYNNKIFGIKVLEVKPESKFNGICVIETDLETDFAPPVGYVEPDYQAIAKEQAEKKAQAMKKPSSTLGTMAKSINYAEIANNASKGLTAFSGDGAKLSSRQVKAKPEPEKVETKEIEINLNGDPAPLSLPDGQLFFGFPLVPVQDIEVEEGKAVKEEKYQFTGEGNSLRKAKKRKDTNDHESSRSKAQSPGPEVIEID
ncbi:hypothetical protein WICPIJ_000265 [Wickerhamomyces pijperi]|uniref:Ubiquitin fusion degradation protein 1 n=1 Tax=Wickerhamomyces pijperi TaxID=599730 RepID=A0A9P8TR06_WICPI|nr:hypothetical protein WICPIJ_000265 [Wickerhamomyces pijperi]